MKHLYAFATLSLFLSFAYCGQSQADYQVFHLGQQYIYSLPDGGEVFPYYAGMKIDEDCQLTYPSIRRTEDFFCSEISTSFAGYEVCIEEDWTLFRVNETENIGIKHDAELGESWMAGLVDGVFLFARVDSIQTKTFLGLTDEVKFINFTYTYNPGDVDFVPFHDHPVQISRQYGLISSIWFRDIPLLDNPDVDFPAAESIELMGLSDPAVGLQNPTLSSIFNLAIGDELHVQRRTTTLIIGPDWYYDRSERIYTITGESFDEVNQIQTYDLSIEELFYRESSDGVYYDSVLMDITGTWTFDFEELAFLDLQPGTLHDIGNGEYITIDLQTNFCASTTVAKFGTSRLYNAEDGCIAIYFDDLNTGAYVDGAAGSYFDHLSFGGPNDRTLQYYATSSGSCGTPYDFSDIVINSVEPSIDNDFALFPNPSQDQITVDTDLPAAYQIVIRNSLGQLIEHKNDLRGDQTLQINRLSSGIYYLQIEMNNGQNTTKRFVKK